MLRRANQLPSEGEPSFFYLIMAEGCFQKAITARHPAASGTLREIGRTYLATAPTVASGLESQQPQSGLKLGH
jgi:hypothetical protein